MIIRVFRARVKQGKRKELERLIRSISIPLVRRQEGLIAYYPGKPMTSNPDEFVMVTIWTDLSSVKKFVGKKWMEVLIPSPKERAAIKESLVRHYKSFGETRRQH